MAVELNERSTVELFLKNNLEIMARKLDVSATQTQVLTSRLWPNPTLNVDYQLNAFGKKWNQTNAGGPAQQDLILYMPIDLNRKRRQGTRVAIMARKISEAQFFKLMFVTDFFSVLNSLYTYRRLIQEHELLKEKHQLLESH